MEMEGIQYHPSNTSIAADILTSNEDTLKHPHPEPLGDTNISIKVGPEHTEFRIDKDLICQSSSYFRAVFQGNFKEATEGLILDEDDPKVFGRFSRWLQNGNILTEATLKSLDCLIGLAIFADHRCIPRLHNQVIDAIIRYAKENGEVSPEGLRQACDNTVASSPLRRLLLEFTVRFGDMHQFFSSEEVREMFSKEFLFDMSLAFYDLREGKMSSCFNAWKERCRFHIHEKDEARCE